ncbi:MAG: hypothetical protein QW607_09835 [Desulfurococcaceae archaeon]
MTCVEICLATGLAGSLITRYLGISESIFWLWIGYTYYIIYSLFARITNKKERYIILLYILFSILIGMLAFSMWNIYKSIISFVSGILVGFLISKLNIFLLEKKIRFWKYQGVVISILVMILLSIILYILNI